MHHTTTNLEPSTNNPEKPEGTTSIAVMSQNFNSEPYYLQEKHFAQVNKMTYAVHLDLIPQNLDHSNGMTIILVMWQNLVLVLYNLWEKHLAYLQKLDPLGPVPPPWPTSGFWHPTVAQSLMAQNPRIVVPDYVSRKHITDCSRESRLQQLRKLILGDRVPG